MSCRVCVSQADSSVSLCWFDFAASTARNRKSTHSFGFAVPCLALPHVDHSGASICKGCFARASSAEGAWSTTTAISARQERTSHPPPRAAACCQLHCGCGTCTCLCTTSASFRAWACLDNLVLTLVPPLSPREPPLLLLLTPRAGT